MRTRLHVTMLAAVLAVAALAGWALAATTPDESPNPSFTDRACGTVDPTPEQAADAQRAIEAYLKSRRFESMAVGGQIKVAFHVIYSGSEGNIPPSQIDAQIAELNRAYSGFYGGANTGYTFVLASVDHTNKSKWFRMTPNSNAEAQAKQALAIDVAHRLNIYTCKPGQNLLGWAHFPQSYPEGDWHHGVVIHYGSVPGGYLSPYNLGGTADHEVGHYLGLYHTFQGGCNAPGDYVSDTPAEATATSGCPGGKDTCPGGGLDPIHNYMDYSTDACYTEFTGGQDGRMDSLVPVYRPSLLNASLIVQGGGSGDGTPPEAARTAMPAGVDFRGAWPNPFSKATMLRFALPRSGHVSLRVYSVTGRLEQTLLDGELSAGEQSVTLESRRFRPGLYFVTLRYEGETRTRSVVVLP